MKIDKKYVYYIIFCLFFFSNLIFHFVDQKNLVLLSTSIVISVLIMVVSKNLYFSLFLALSIVSVLSLVLSGSYAAGRLLLIGNTYVAILVALIISKNKKMALNATNLTLVVFYCLLSVELISNNFDFHFFHVYMNEYFANESRNIISAVILFLSILHLSLSHFENQKSSFLLISMGVFFNILLYGRSGIALQLILLTLALAGLNKKTIIAIVVLALLGVFSINDLDNGVENRFSDNALDSPRYQMNDEFIQQVSLNSLVTGANLKDLPTASYFDGNPHNTFVYYNIQYNIVSLLLMMFCIFTLYLSLKNDRFVFILASVLFLRINLDSFIDNLWLVVFVLFFLQYFKRLSDEIEIEIEN